MGKRSLVRDARRFHMGWRVWFWVLILVNVVGPLLFIDRLEAQLTLAAYIVSGIVIVALHRRAGWIRLLGMGHFPWLALLPWLAYRHAEASAGDLFGAWLAAVIVVDTACLIIDAVDISRFIRGERQPIVWASENRDA